MNPQLSNKLIRALNAGQQLRYDGRLVRVEQLETGPFINSTFDRKTEIELGWKIILHPERFSVEPD